eukprot:2101613-Amphidinium_carterae.1
MFKYVASCCISNNECLNLLYYICFCSSTSLIIVNSRVSQDLANNRYVFINVWRNINDEPVQQCPLAVCDPDSIDYSKILKYEMHYPDRVGSNYALEYSPEHRWYYYPRMVKDECLLFKVCENATLGKPPKPPKNRNPKKMGTWEKNEENMREKT